jgi:hypothetical protein
MHLETMLPEVAPRYVAKHYSGALPIIRQRAYAIFATRGIAKILLTRFKGEETYGGGGYPRNVNAHSAIHGGK